jgi:AsmA protein
VSFSAQAAGASLVGEGTLTWPLGSPGWDLRLTLQGERIDALNTLLQTQLPAIGPYKLSAKLDRTKSAYRLSSLEVRIEDNHAIGEVELTTAGSRKRIVAKLSADELDLDDWIEWLQSAKAKKALTQDQQFVFANLDMPVGWLPHTDLQLQLEVSRIEAVDTNFGNMRVNVQAEQGRLVMGPLEANMAGGQISGTLELDASTGMPSSRFELTVRHLDYGHWLKALHVTDKVEGTLDIKITLRGSGDTLRAMLADANGAALLASGPAHIADSGLGLWGAGFTSGLMSITTSALGMKKSTEFNCMVWPFNVSDGVALSDAILMDTPKITIAGSGTIDLGTEELDILLEPARKDASIFSFQNPVRITGTLANPKRTTLGKAKTFGKLGLVILQPYLLLFTAELGAGEKNPCVAALAGEPPPTKRRRKKKAVERDLGLVGQLLTEMQKPVNETRDTPASRPEP